MGPLVTLNDDIAAGRVNPRNIFLGDFWFVTPAVALSRTFDDLNAAIEIAWDNVPVMKKSILLESDIDKSRLKPVFRLRTLPLKMLPTRRSSVVRSMLNSRAFLPRGRPRVSRASRH